MNSPHKSGRRLAVLSDDLMVTKGASHVVKLKFEAWKERLRTTMARLLGNWSIPDTNRLHGISAQVLPDLLSGRLDPCAL